MEQDSLLTEVILTHPRQSLGEIQLDWMPQPGNYLALKGQTYAVLERHHQYQYKIGGYCLRKVPVKIVVFTKLLTLKRAFFGNNLTMY